MSTDPASPASPSASPCLRADPDHGPCQEVCEEAQGQIAGGLAVEHGAQIMHWEEGGWKPYRGPRNPEGLVRIMRAEYMEYGLKQGGGEQAATELDAEAASFERLVKQLQHFSLSRRYEYNFV